MRACMLLWAATLVLGPWTAETLAQDDPFGLGFGKCGVVASVRDEGNGPGFTPEMLSVGAAAGLQWQTAWSPFRLQDGFRTSDYGNVKLVPQEWGGVDHRLAERSRPLASVLLGFNEPDQTKEGGSGIDVGEAVDKWMEMVGIGRTRGFEYFVAPSIAGALPSKYTYKGNGSEWLPTFLESCLVRMGCPETINFLGFHLYEPRCPTDPEVVKTWNFDVRVVSMKRLMDDFNSRGMSIKGLFLTEFAGRSDEDGLCSTLEQQKGWMEVFLPLLNQEPTIAGYSWFSYGEGRSQYFHDNANLWDYETGQLNELGEAYFRICSGGAMATTAGPTPVVGPGPHPGRGHSRLWLWLFLFLLGVSCAVAAGGYFVSQNEDGPCRLDHGTAPLCHDSACEKNPSSLPSSSETESEGEAGAWEPDLEMSEALPAEVREAVIMACGCVAEKSRFERDAEEALKKLRRTLFALPVEPVANVSAGASEVTLSEVPHKREIWQFIMLISEKRRFYKAQAEELARRLEQNPLWQEVLDRDSQLRQRRAKLDRSITR